jgi:MFS family permease
MNPRIATPRSIQRIYLTLLLFNTLAASMIWGINTIFLLNAGLSNFEAFAANAFFTAGEVLFEIPTGVIADSWGRRTSYLLGTITLLLTTYLYWLMWQQHAPFWQWAGVSMLLGLGFTFFSGATDAWLVDALKFTGFKGTLDAVFARAQIITGAAMLVGSVSGGFIAQKIDLGVPYLLRSALLGLTFIMAFIYMKDLGFTPDRSKHPLRHTWKILHLSLEHGIRNRKIKWVMYAAPFGMGVSVYVFYALQPYLLNLYGDEKAYGIAGLTAAIVAGAQIVGGLIAPHAIKLLKKRTTILLTGGIMSAVLLAGMGIFGNFYAVILLVALWGLIFAAVRPTRQAFLNEHIPTDQRATVLSFDSLLSSSGGIVSQPVLGKSADIWGYPTSYLLASTLQVLAIPLLLRAKKETES